jgi:cob(I)alamin adenosyltransferase
LVSRPPEDGPATPLPTTSLLDEATRARREAAIQALTEARDAHQKTADVSKRRRGLLIVNAGHGKATSALGLMPRAHGQSLRVQLFQFLKRGGARFGEHRAPDVLGVLYEGLGDGFIWHFKDLEHSAALAAHGWAQARDH